MYGPLRLWYKAMHGVGRGSRARNTPQAFLLSSHLICQLCAAAYHWLCSVSGFHEEVCWITDRFFVHDNVAGINYQSSELGVNLPFKLLKLEIPKNLITENKSSIWISIQWNKWNLNGIHFNALYYRSCLHNMERKAAHSSTSYVEVMTLNL